MTSRNAPCPCGSGKKYKRCCIDKDPIASFFNPTAPIPDTNRFGNDFLPIPAPQPKVVINHPAFAEFRMQNPLDMSIQNFCQLSFPILSSAFLKGKKQAHLIDFLHANNLAQEIQMHIFREQDALFMQLDYESASIEIMITKEYVISHKGSDFGEGKYDAFLHLSLYILWCLGRGEKSPANTGLVYKKWSCYQKLFRSLFFYSEERAPVTLEKVILGADLPASNCSTSAVIKAYKYGSINDMLGSSLNTRTKDHYQERSFYQQVIGACERKYFSKYNRIGNHRYFRSIAFVFSDGVSLTYDQVLTHPYGILIPFDLNPISIGCDLLYDTYGSKSYFYLSSKDKSVSRLIYKLKASYIERILDYNQKINKKNIQGKVIDLLLTDMDDIFSFDKLEQSREHQIHEDLLIPVYKVEGKREYMSTNSKWYLGKGKLICELTSFKSDPNMVSANNQEIMYDIKEKCLYTNLVYDVWKEIGVIINCSKNDFHNSYYKQNLHANNYALKNAFKLGRNEFDLPEKINLKQLFMELTNCLNRYQIDFRFSQDLLKIDAEDFIINWNFIPEADEVKIAISPELIFGNNQRIQVSLTNHVFMSLWGGLIGGIGGHFYLYENTSMVSRATSLLKRKNSLKFLRHAGIYRLILAEFVQEFKDQKNLSAKDKEKIIKQITKNAIRTFQTIELFKSHLPRKEVSEKELSKVQLSTSITNTIKKLIEELVMEMLVGNECIMIYQGTLYCINASKLFFVITEKLINNIFEAYGDDTVTKSTLKHFSLSITPDTSLYYQSFQIADDQKEKAWLKSLELAKKLIGCQEDLFNKFYFEGKPLEYLSENAISAELKIGEMDGKIDWFSLHPKVYLQGVEVEFADVAKSILDGKNIIAHAGKYYYINKKSLPKLKWLDYFWQRICGKKNRSIVTDRNQLIAHQERSLILEFLNLKKLGVHISGNAQWDKIEAAFEQIENPRFNLFEVHPTSIPFKDYQKAGVQWMYQLYQLGIGGILADDMGLGKTVQAIGLLDVLKKDLYSSKLNLVIVPTSLVYNWQKEVEKFAPNLRIDIFESKNKCRYEEMLTGDNCQIDLLIVTYGLLLEHDQFFLKHEWGVVFFDEAQNLKNIISKRTTIARQLVAKVKYCITGTPMENHYGEFYSLLDIAVPGVLGEYRDFVTAFGLKKIVKANDADSSGDSNSANFSLHDEIEHLKRKISPLVLRRLKKDLLKDLPDKLESVVSLAFEGRQKKIYKDIAISWNEKVKSLIKESGETKANIHMLTALLRLRQACSSPQIIKDVKYADLSPKFELLLDNLEGILESGESALVFTNFKSSQDILHEMALQKGFPSFAISGETPSRLRQEILANFNKEGHPTVLFLTLKTGGVGLNLTKASYVFHVEPWWNPAAENQATDRTHRIGQTKNVQVYRYIMHESVEEKIQELKSVKDMAFCKLLGKQNDFESDTELNNPKMFTGSLSYADFQYLTC